MEPSHIALANVTTAHDLVEIVEDAYVKGTITRKLRMYTKPALLILDEIGYQKNDENRHSPILNGILGIAQLSL